MNGIQKAVEKAGGQSALAILIGGRVRQAHVWKWLRSGKPPEIHCPAIERGTGVHCEELRPDVIWRRDKRGNVTGYTVDLRKSEAA